MSSFATLKVASPDCRPSCAWVKVDSAYRASGVTDGFAFGDAQVVGAERWMAGGERHVAVVAGFS